MFQKVDHLRQLSLGFIGPHHVVETDSRIPHSEDLRLVLAKAQSFLPEGNDAILVVDNTARWLLHFVTRNRENHIIAGGSTPDA